jgi:hypothetical protein
MDMEQHIKMVKETLKMKKIFAIVVAVILLIVILLIVSCERKSAIVPEQSPTKSTTPTELVSEIPTISEPPVTETTPTVQPTPTETPTPTPPPTQKPMPTPTYGVPIPVIPDKIPEYIPGSIELGSADNVGFDLPYTVTKREIYYKITGYIMEIVSDAEYDKFSKYINSISVKGEPTTMYVKDFVMYFNIPKDVFLQAVEKERLLAEKFGESVNTAEWNELPNADIIYTFDDEIIDNYYRRA